MDDGDLEFVFGSTDGIVEASSTRRREEDKSLGYTPYEGHVKGEEKKKNRTCGELRARPLFLIVV